MILNKKKRITWVTPDYFVDCDFEPTILSEILQHYDIIWIILLSNKSSRYSEEDFNILRKLEGLKIEFLYSSYRQRDPRRLSFYFELYKRIKAVNADLTYLNCVPDPYFVPFFWLLDKNKTIFCAHDGEVHRGFDFKLITSISFKLSYSIVKNVCMFSRSQANIFHKNFHQANIYVISLALKAFGDSALLKSANTITFLSFGVINYSKNIELLIEAACNIYEKGYKNFNVSINGQCVNWDFYKSFIRYPHLFKCDIRFIENKEIPELFSTSHYLVQPYRHVSQSGALKVALYYNLPVIATNLPGFSDEIIEGINGYLFNPSDIRDLERLMINVLDHHHSVYPTLLQKMARYTQENYSSLRIASKYLHMFNEVINGKSS